MKGQVFRAQGTGAIEVAGGRDICKVRDRAQQTEEKQDLGEIIKYNSNFCLSGINYLSDLNDIWLYYVKLGLCFPHFSVTLAKLLVQAFGKYLHTNLKAFPHTR